jgi:hypothetical protein
MDWLNNSISINQITGGGRSVILFSASKTPRPYKYSKPKEAEEALFCKKKGVACGGNRHIIAREISRDPDPRDVINLPY